MTSIYEAIVIDNKQFYIDGYIYVKVENLNLDIPKDLTDDFKPDMFKKPDDFGCLKARVFSPMAGGKNYGVFYLPQVNSRGLVATINDDRLELIWLGSFFEMIDKQFDEKGNEKLTINAPQDNLELDGNNTSLIVDGENLSKNMSQEAIVIRTKKTSNESKDEMDWDKIHTSNLIVIDGDRIEINRAITGGYDSKGNLDKYQKFLLGEEDGKIVTKIEYVDKTGNINSSFKIEDGSLKTELVKGESGSALKQSLVLGIVNDNPVFAASIKDELNDISTSLKTSNEELVLSYNKGDKATYYVQNEDTIKLTSPEAAISIKKDEVALDGKTIRISAKTLLLGSGNQKIVTTDSSLPGAQLTDGAFLYFRSDKKA